MKDLKNKIYNNLKGRYRISTLLISEHELNIEYLKYVKLNNIESKVADSNYRKSYNALYNASKDKELMIELLEEMNEVQYE